MPESPQNRGSDERGDAPVPPNDTVPGGEPPGTVNHATQAGATARPVDGEIMPAHRPRLFRFATICGTAWIVVW